MCFYAIFNFYPTQFCSQKLHLLQPSLIITSGQRYRGCTWHLLTASCFENAIRVTAIVSSIAQKRFKRGKFEVKIFCRKKKKPRNTRYGTRHGESVCLYEEGGGVVIEFKWQGFVIEWTHMGSRVWRCHVYPPWCTANMGQWGLQKTLCNEIIYIFF